MKFDEAYSGRNAHIKFKYTGILAQYNARFGDSTQPRFFSAPAAVAISGELTEPQHGKTVSAAITADLIAAAEATDETVILIVTEDNKEFYLDFGKDNDGSAYGEAVEFAEYINALRTIIKTFTDSGLKIGGFRAVVHSRVYPGLPVDECAAFSVLASIILAEFYNGGNVNKMKLATSLCARLPKSGADCAVSLTGGFVAADFKDAPVVQRVALKADAPLFYICIINANYGDSVPASSDPEVYEDMQKICDYFAVSNLSRLSSEDICLNMVGLRTTCGDRAILRALFFFDENYRSDNILYSIETGAVHSLFEHINAAGGSLYKYLRPRFQVSEMYRPIVAGMCVAESELGVRGAFRVYFGKHASCQAFVPAGLVKDFKLHIERVFGLNTCHVFGLREHPACEVEVDFAQLHRDIDTAVIREHIKSAADLGDMVE